MPRNGGGVFSLPTTYEAVSGQTIEAQQHNDPLEDLEQDANTARPIVAGGTGATTAVAATDNFSTKGADVASATTTDIGAATGRFVHITGTTTITGFGTKTAGVVRFLTFDAALTLTHNATSLILPGGANITTAAGDSAVMVSEGGGNWRCHAYTKATGGAVVGGGKGSAIASASTISIGSELFYHVTGTTTITDIDFAVAGDGRWAILEFDGAVTLTHNATTLVLPGGANIVTAAGDIAIVVQDSGDNVHVVSFQRAASGRVSRVVRQVFTGSGTYTPTTGMQYADIEAVGAGGGGGGTGISSVGQLASAGGGGGGEWAFKRVTAADIGASKAVTIGAAGSGGAAGNNNGTAGGDTSVGSLCVAKGGSAGVGNNANSGSAGGDGGTGGTGDILIPGQAGGNGAGGSGLTVETFGGYGGMSARGYGMGARARRSESQPGNAGSGYGSGGGGGMDRNGSSSRAGGNGTAGIVIITEYVQ